MKYVSRLQTIHEDMVYKDYQSYQYTNHEEIVETIETVETGTTDISIDCIDSILPSITRDRYCSKDIHSGYIAERICGKGILVRKITNRFNGIRYRRLYVMGKYMYISSIFSTKEISINEVDYVKNVGKNLTIRTPTNGVLVLKTPVLMDAIALRQLLR